MAFARTAIGAFDLANNAYIGATVAFYTVSSGARTTTLATLYDSVSGAGTLANPQTLDDEGKFSIPVYAEVEVIGVVSGSSADDHETGIITPSLSDGDVTAAAASAAAAAGSATASAASAAAALSSAADATTEKGYAEEWAQKAEDSPVSVDAGGDGATTFSALHHSAKAEGFATQAAATVGAVKVSSDDTTPGDLEAKVLAGAGLTATTQNGGGNETRTLALDTANTNLSLQLLFG